MKLKEVYKKQGGFELIKYYWRGGALFTAISEFLLLGHDTTALEILRLSAYFKTKKRLKKQYSNTLNEFNENWEERPHENSDIVWVCWFQGMDKAPRIVQKCYQSLQNNLINRRIILITEKNMEEFVQLPQYIIEKWKKGQITYTHMTDILRLELLIRYGGMWLDATVLCTESCENIPSYYFNSELFIYQCLKPGRDGQSHLMSSWLISAKSNNKVLMAVRHLCYEYWKQNTKMVDYFLFHDFFSIALEYYQKEWKKIVPRDNATPHILLLRLFEPFDEFMWEAIRVQSPFHKLSYKFDEEQKNLKGTFYDVLFCD